MKKILLLSLTLLIIAPHASAQDSYQPTPREEEIINEYLMKAEYPLDPELEAELKNKISPTALEMFKKYLAYLEAFKYPIDIAGKVVDENGNLITDEVTLTAWRAIFKGIDFSEYGMESDETYEEHTKIIMGGTFSWKLPPASDVSITASKRGYHEDSTSVTEVKTEEHPNGILMDRNIVLHLVTKGEPVDLVCVDNGAIVSPEEEPSGWSFTHYWYFPESNPRSHMILTVDNNDNIIVTMKGDGGFIEHRGYTYSEHTKTYWARFEEMVAAPAAGYKQSITLTENNIKKMEIGGGDYYYFKTPDGKYGKMRIADAGNFMRDVPAVKIRFSYYLNPSGGRSLELKNKIMKYPIHPDEAEWLQKTGKNVYGNPYGENEE